MRGDNDLEASNKKDSEPTDSANTKVFGYNILKVARTINMLVGLGLSVICGFQIFNLFSTFGNLFTNPGSIFLNIFNL